MAQNRKSSYMTISHLNYSAYDDNAQINSTLIEEEIKKINKIQATSKANKLDKRHASPDLRNNIDKFLKRNQKFPKIKNYKKKQLSPVHDCNSNPGVHIQDIITNKISFNKNTKNINSKNKKNIIKKINVNGYGNKKTRKPININSILNSKKKYINGNLTKNQKSFVKSNILSNKNKNPFKNFPKQPSTEEEHLKSIKYNKKSKTNIYRDINIDNQQEIKTVKQNSNNSKNFIIMKNESEKETNNNTSFTFPQLYNESKYTHKFIEHPLFYFKKKILLLHLEKTLLYLSYDQIDDNTICFKTEEQRFTDEKIYIKLRPGLDIFLSELSKYYDLYAFSTSSKSLALNTFNLINVKNFIKNLFIYEEDKLILKNFLKINENLPNIVLLLNNFPYINSLNELNQNIIQIKSYFGSNNDNALYFIKPLLKNLSGYYDVREEIKKFVHCHIIDEENAYKWMVERYLNKKFLDEIREIINKNQGCNHLVVIKNAKKIIMPINKNRTKVKTKEIEKLNSINLMDNKIKKINYKYNDNKTYNQTIKSKDTKTNDFSFINRNYSRYQNNSVNSYFNDPTRNKDDFSMPSYIANNYIINNNKIKTHLRNSASYKNQNRIIKKRHEGLLPIYKKEDLTKNSKLNIIINNSNNSASSLQRTMNEYSDVGKTNLFNNININKFISIKENPAFIINLDFIQKNSKFERSRSTGRLMERNSFKSFLQSSKKRNNPIFNNLHGDLYCKRVSEKYASPKYKRKYVFNFK